MPSLLESNDYELFDYRHADEQPLSLEEALRKAAALRDADRSHFHRIVPTDPSLSGFRIESVSRDEAYADLVGRVNSMVARILNKMQKREAR